MSSLRINSTHCNISAKVDLPTILSELPLLVLLVSCIDLDSIPYFCQVSVLWVNFGKMGRWHWQWHWQGKADFETDRCKNGRHKCHWADSLKFLSVWQNWKSDIDKAKLILKLIVVGTGMHKCEMSRLAAAQDLKSTDISTMWTLVFWSLFLVFYSWNWSNQIRKCPWADWQLCLIWNEKSSHKELFDASGKSTKDIKI